MTSENGKNSYSQLPTSRKLFVIILQKATFGDITSDINFDSGHLRRD